MIKSGLQIPIIQEVNDHNKKKSWRWHNCEPIGDIPCPRSLHASVQLDKKIYIFGGFDGANRKNDFFVYSIETNEWIQIRTNDMPPSPRDRHAAVVHDRSIFIFGGYDGTNKVNDFYEFNIDNTTWSEVIYSGMGVPPSPRHSHTCVVYEDSMYVFGGFDGNYRNDFHRFNFITNTWSQISNQGSLNAPKARYRTSACVHKDCMYIFGGHDGCQQLNDFYLFNFLTEEWNPITYHCGAIPTPRDSHILASYASSLFIFGGSTRNAVADFYEYKIDETKWFSISNKFGAQPSPRFCHTGCVSNKGLFIFGGYDGKNRLGDLILFQFDDSHIEIPTSTLLKDLCHYVNNEEFSDITIIVEGRKKVFAHKLLLMRCTYFQAMLKSNMKEQYQKTINIENVSYEIFQLILKYLYTDDCEITLENAMELFEAADLFGIERLKRLCEQSIMSNITMENAAAIFQAADMHHAQILRDNSVRFILQNFDEVSKTTAFEQLAKTNIDLILEILHKR